MTELRTAEAFCKLYPPTFFARTFARELATPEDLPELTVALTVFKLCAEENGIGLRALARRLSLGRRPTRPRRMAAIAMLQETAGDMGVPSADWESFFDALIKYLPQLLEIFIKYILPLIATI